MTRSVILFVAGIVIFGAGLVLFLRERVPVDSARSQSALATSTPAPKAAPPASRRVAIAVDGLNFTFAPSTVTVRRGTRVTWVNKTASPHTITSVTPRLFDFPIAGYAKVVLVFHRPGTYQYFCALHPYMLGVINVRR
jgi:plastocyanin